MRIVVVIVLLAAVAYYVWNEEAPPQPSVDTQQQVEADTQGGLIEEHLLSPLGRAQNLKDEKYVKGLDEHRAQMDKQDQ